MWKFHMRSRSFDKLAGAGRQSKNGLVAAPRASHGRSRRRGLEPEPNSELIPTGGEWWNRGAKQRFRFALLVRCTALLIVAVASARQGRFALLTRRLPTAGAVRMLERAPAGRFIN